MIQFAAYCTDKSIVNSYKTQEANISFTNPISRPRKAACYKKLFTYDKKLRETKPRQPKDRLSIMQNYILYNTQIRNA